MIRLFSMDNLSTYLLYAMMKWAPLSDHKPESEEETLARYESIAQTIADVVHDSSEPPLWKDDPTRAKTGLLLAAIGFMEGRYWKFVDNGDCNDPKKIKDRRGSCDGGKAYSIWQVWPHEGLVLDSPGWNFARNYSKEWRAEHAAEIITGARMIADRTLACRAALHMIRVSLRATKTLCIYTGERCEGSMPLAIARMNVAKSYWTRHPFVEVQNAP